MATQLRPRNLQPVEISTYVCVQSYQGTIMFCNSLHAQTHCSPQTALRPTKRAVTLAFLANVFPAHSYIFLVHIIQLF